MHFEQLAVISNLAALLLYAGDRTVTDQVAQIELLLNELSQRAN